MMDPSSPLTRQTQDSFQPKIIQLYSELFNLNDEDFLPSEGFWREFYLLKPEKRKFTDLLEPLTANDLLHIHRQTRNFVQKTISEVASTSEPQNENALENLTAFLAAALGKKYTNPSTDIIEVIAGLENIDKVMTDLVNTLDMVVSKSPSTTFRRKAIDNVLAIVSGSYQTSLVTYFIHKDFFQGFIKYVQHAPEAAPVTLSLLGILANYNKFEAQNIYQNRMEDFINEEVMLKLVDGFANTCGDMRDAYVAVQDDSPAQWTIGSTLSYVGLRALTPEAKKPPPPTEDEAKALFSALPGVNAVILQAAYSFVQANNIFASHLISTASDADLESPLAAFLSITSYLAHHAHRNPRTLHYTLLPLFTLRLLVEDPILTKRLSSPDHKITVRLARQRPPHLPHLTTPRVPTTIILDILTDTLSHNLRKRLSVPLYHTTLTTLHQILTRLSANRTRLPHHWSYIWLSLISLLRFLTTYATNLLAQTSTSTSASTTTSSPTPNSDSPLHQMLAPLTTTLTHVLLHGDSFLPDPPSYDDLFYKLVETSQTLPLFKSAYTITSPPLPSTSPLLHATDALIAISAHYESLLKEAGSKKSHRSPKDVAKVIGEGHETFGDVVGSLGTGASGGGGVVGGNEEFGRRGEKWRESEWKGELKRIMRTVVEDGRVLALQ